MELTNQYKSGLLKLAALLGLLCFFILVSNWWPRSEPALVLDEETQCFIENQESILVETKTKTNYTYYVNSINDYSGYQLGLSVGEIDRLLVYRETGGKIYTLQEFKRVTKIDSLKLEAIKQSLVFPKQKNIFKRKITSNLEKRKSLNRKSDINIATSKQLHTNCNLSWEISNRIVNFRNSIKVYTSMKQLNKVYGISESDLLCLNTNYKVTSK